MQRKGQHFAQVLLATDLSQKLRTALEFAVAVAILMFVTGIAAENMQSAVIRSQAAEAFMMTSDVKVAMIAYRAENGEWPSEREDIISTALSEGYDLGKYVDRIELGTDGALSIVFDDEYSSEPLQNRRLTYRPSTSVEDPAAPIVWVCARYPVLDGLEPSGVDETDIETIHLPSICREH